MKHPLPKNILDQIQFHCEASNLGLAIIGFDGFSLTIIADKDLHPNGVALLAARTLIDGILSDHWKDANAEALTKKEEMH